MSDRTVARYSFIDDLFKSAGHAQDSRQHFSDAQVVTLAVMAMLDFGGNFERANNVIAQWRIFSQKRLLRSRFSRRLNRLSDLLHLLFHRLGKVLKELNLESRYVLDSFPVQICDNIRIKKCRLTKDVFNKEDYRGFRTSKRRYFFGIKVQVIATGDGVPVEFSILPTRCTRFAGLI